jgi:hypothetical protein
MCKHHVFNCISKTRRVPRCLQHLQNASHVRHGNGHSLLERVDEGRDRATDFQGALLHSLINATGSAELSHVVQLTKPMTMTMTLSESDVGGWLVK